MIILVLLVMFKVLFIIYPTPVVGASREGLVLWFNHVLPALLPFVIIANLLVALGFHNMAGRFFTPVMERLFKLPGVGGFAFVSGVLSGYPVGAKTVAAIHKAGEINAKEAQHLLAFCSNAGPLFILGVVGVGLFGSARVGYVLWAGHVLSAIVLGVLLGIGKQGRKVKSTQYVAPIKFNKALGESIKNAMEAMLVVGGLIVFFSAVMAVLRELGLPETGVLAGFINGLLEMTAGIRGIAQGGVNTITLGAVAFVIAFGGFSVHMQALHFADGTGISTQRYLWYKFLHGVLAVLVTVGIWMV